MGEIAQFNPDSTPPAFSTEAEQQVLGSILLNPDRVSTVSGRGGEDLFFDPVHAEIFKIIEQRARDGFLVSPVALGEWANSHDGVRELGGRGYLVRMAGASVGGNQIQHYADHLADLRVKRTILTATDTARREIIAGIDPAAVIGGRLEAALSSLGATTGPQPVSMTKAVTIAMEQSIAAQNGESGDFVQTGIPTLDKMMTGLYPGELILLGGRPSMGKTSVALNIGLNAARAGHGVVIASLEMNPEAMALRAISEATSNSGNAISYRDIRQGEYHADWQKETVAQAAKEVSGLPIQFLSRQYSDIGALLAGAKQAKRILGDNMRLLIVDYAQLLKSPARSRYEQITEISMALKNLAGQMNVPVLALSQLSRQLESRDDKRPQLSDLRESGQLEQDADAVMFCYRDEYYLEREKPDGQDFETLDAWQGAMERARNKLEIIVAKQRQGPTGTAHVMCNVALNRIWEA